MSRARSAVAGGECPRQCERLRAVLGRQAHVSRRQRQAVAVAHGGHHAQLQRQVEIANHAADHRHLLRVLLAEVHRVWPDDVEQLEADRRHAAEVPRAAGALQHVAQGVHFDPRVETGRVDLADRRCEEDVHARRFGHRDVARQVARVALEIRRVAELRGIDEQADDHRVALAAGRVEQRHVSRVERAHRRDEADAAAARQRERGADRRDGVDDLNGAHKDSIVLI